ncbi:MAG: phosphoribosylformylglycinamidine synthase [Methylacidiphilales bacterium]|nr:phosphoribosylformylglycinamidine synthase [Candidatus Methylacidiphilales bacterium]
MSNNFVVLKSNNQFVYKSFIYNNLIFTYRKLFLIHNLFSNINNLEEILNATYNTDYMFIKDIYFPQVGFQTPEETKILRILRFNQVDLANLQSGLFFEDQNLPNGLLDQMLWKKYSNINDLTNNNKVFYNSYPGIFQLMFDQINSEHCRHHTFKRKRLYLDSLKNSLFETIKTSFKKQTHNDLILSAYDDNASCIKGGLFNIVSKDFDGFYSCKNTSLDLILKVETHNHPTAIAPYPGAATGVGGEIRDELAIGRGGISNFGISAYITADLNIPNLTEKWEINNAINLQYLPRSVQTPLSIMIQAPIGTADFGNEFGRPLLSGFFRTIQSSRSMPNRAAFKPLMLAGGCGVVHTSRIRKNKVPVGALLVIIGGPSYRIGMGGGSLSSKNQGEVDADLEFSSVQRSNPEMQRLCHEVVLRLIECDTGNDVIVYSIHDAGAGGLSCAIPEMLHENELGVSIEMEKIPSGDTTLSAEEIWCCEAQERLVLAINPNHIEIFESICNKETCPFAIIGSFDGSKKLRLIKNSNEILNTDISLLFPIDNSIHVINNNDTIAQNYPSPEYEIEDFEKSLCGLLRFPSIARKNFLLTIADRSVGGKVVQDQFVGPYQEPINDCAISVIDFYSTNAQALAMGERAEIAITNPEASVRLALAEAITNFSGIWHPSLSTITLSANWMADRELDLDFVTLCKEVDILSEFVKELDMCISVGKDSLSMRTNMLDKKFVNSPPYVVITAMACIDNYKKIVTPLLTIDHTTVLCRIDFSNHRRIGGSAFSRTENLAHFQTPDLTDAKSLIAFKSFINILIENNEIYAYHDISDGGMLISLLEMAFSARCGISIDTSIASLKGYKLYNELFSEEPGAIIQIKKSHLTKYKLLAEKYGLFLHEVATLYHKPYLNLHFSQIPLAQLWSQWNKISYHIQSIRDGESFAQDEELFNINSFTESKNKLSCKIIKNKLNFEISKNLKNIVGILREEGTNGHIELVTVLSEAGFTVREFSLNQILANNVVLQDFGAIFFPGGFTYGDVLGAGQGVATSILHNQIIKKEFFDYFNRPDSITIGFCNGCQIGTLLKSIIPNSEGFVTFKKNLSGRFESRLTMCQVPASPSLFLSPIAGSELPIIVSHGEGRVEQIQNNTNVALYYSDTKYPINPNGSVNGIAGICTSDGRVTLLMPHPERLFKTFQYSWLPPEFKSLEYGPWFEVFYQLKKTLQS